MFDDKNASVQYAIDKETAAEKPEEKLLYTIARIALQWEVKGLDVDETVDGAMAEFAELNADIKLLAQAYRFGLERQWEIGHSEEPEIPDTPEQDVILTGHAFISDFIDEYHPDYSEEFNMIEEEVNGS